MPEVDESEVEKMTPDEIEQAVAKAVDTGNESDDQEVMGFAQRDS